MPEPKITQLDDVEVIEWTLPRTRYTITGATREAVERVRQDYIASNPSGHTTQIRDPQYQPTDKIWFSLGFREPLE